MASAVAAAVVAIGCAVVVGAERGLTFSGDDWTFITERRGFSVGVFLRPHNEHLSALPIGAYKLLLAIFGATSYVPFLALLLLVHALCCLLLYLVLCPYVGPWTALAPTAVLAVLGPAWQDLLWAFQVGYLGSVSAGLGMVLCLERRDRAGDIGAAALLCVSLLCSSIGLAMVVLGLVLLVLERPRAPRRLWTIGVPVGLYLVWYAIYGVSTARIQNITRIPKYAAQALSAALGSITGLAQTHVSPYVVSTTLGRWLALIAVLALAYYLIRGGRVPPLTWAALVSALALWSAQCLEYFTAARSPNQSRYQYAAATLLLLAIGAGANRLRTRSGAVLALLTAAICASNVALLYQRSNFWRQNSVYVKAETGALNMVRGLTALNFTPENGFTVPLFGNHNLYISAGPYFSAVAAFGSPGDTTAGLLRRPEPIREAADEVLASAEQLRLTADPAFNPRRPGCRSAVDGKELGELTLRAGSVAVRVAHGTAAELQLRRFASRYRYNRLGNAPPVFRLPRFADGRPLILRLPADHAAIPWRLRLAGGRHVVACVDSAI